MNATWKRKLGWVAFAASSVWPLTGTADCRAVSPEYTVALLELYTSEGCDSCPPADRWFSGLDFGPPPAHATALAFHVDYWDRYGWRDRFDSTAYTQRQQEEMQRHDSTNVYTPQVLLQGSEFATWRTSRQPTKAVSLINARPPKATIELAAVRTDHASIAVDVHVRVAEEADRAHAVVDVALVQSGLATDVKAGENEGKHLIHDHVVRAWRSGLAVGPSGELQQRVELPLPSDSGPIDIVAFAEDTKSGNVLQALTLPLCDH
jgi:hypothetical protein